MRILAIVYMAAAAAMAAEVEFSTYLGSIGGASAESVAVDRQGYIYVTGTVTSNHFPLVLPLQGYFAGSNDVFVAKFDPTGRELIYSTYLGSWGDDRATDIAVGDDGAVYVTGFTTSPQFPVANAAQTESAGGSFGNGGDVFAFKLSPDGQKLVWSTFWGGSGDDFGRSIAVDAAGSVYVGGSTTSLDFLTVNGVQTTREGSRDAFALKLDASGQVVFATLIGGVGVEEGYGVGFDPEGNVVLAGTSTTNDYFPFKNALQENYGGGARDVFVAKFSPAGETMFATFLGGTGDDFGRNLAVDREGHIYITGYTTSATYPTRNALQTAFRGNRDFIVTKMLPDGSGLVWSTLHGGGSLDDAYAISLDGENNVYVAGISQSLNFPAVNAVQPAIGSPNCRATPCTADIAMAAFRADGRQVLLSSYFGGGGTDNGRGVAAIPGGGAVLTGNTTSTNFPLTNAFQIANNGGGAAVSFVVRVK